MAKRLVFTIRRSCPGSRVPSARDCEDALLLLRAGPQAWLRLVVDGLALDLVDHLVKRGLVADADRVTAQRAPVDDERDLGDVGVRGALVHLVGELDDGIGPVVEEAFEPAHLALGVVANPVRDLDILALHDGPHAHLRVRASGFEYSPDPADQRSRATVMAEVPSAPASSSASAHAARVAPVVTTSSTRRTQRPTRRSSRPEPATNAPATLAARSRRSRSNWAIVARSRVTSVAYGQLQVPCGDAGDELRLVVAPCPCAGGVDRHVRDEVRPDADPRPSTRDRRPERLGEPLLARRT